MGADELVVVAEAAAELHLSSRRVRMLLADGTLDGVRDASGWRVQRGSLEQLKASRWPGLVAAGPVAASAATVPDDLAVERAHGLELARQLQSMAEQCLSLARMVVALEEARTPGARAPSAEPHGRSASA